MKTGSTITDLPIPIGYFRLILRYFGTDPGRRAAILAGTEVSEAALRELGTEIALGQQLRQIANIEALVGEDWPLTPELRLIHVHGAIGVAALSAPDIGAAMQVLARLASVHAPYCRLGLHTRAQSVELEFRLEVALEVAEWRPLIEFSLLAVHAIITALLGRPPAEARYGFNCPPPPYADRLRAVLGGLVCYDAPTNSITIPRNWSDIPSPFADPILFAHATEELQAALQRLTDPVTVRGRVERLLAAMPDGRIAGAAVARQLGLSPRTLVRRLGSVDTTFRILLENEMSRRARRLLDCGNLSHAEIATRLGYNDAASFSRACRRWSAADRL